MSKISKLNSLPLGTSTQPGDQVVLPNGREFILNNANEWVQKKSGDYLEDKGILTTENLNIINVQGIYHQLQNILATTTNNYPTTSSGTLEVRKGSNDQIFQQYTVLSGQIDEDTTFIRGNYAGIWSTWKIQWNSKHFNSQQIDNWNNLVNQSSNFVTLNTNQDISGIKKFLNNSGNNNVLNDIKLRVQGSNGSRAGIAFYSTPDIISAITLDYSGKYHFTGDADITQGYNNIKVGGVEKQNSSDNHILLGAGGHKLVSDFVLSNNTTYVPYINATQDLLLGNNLIKAKGFYSSDNLTKFIAASRDFWSGHSKILISITNTGGTQASMGDIYLDIFRYAGQSFRLILSSYKYNYNWHSPAVYLSHGNVDSISSIRLLKESDAKLWVEINFTLALSGGKVVIGDSLRGAGVINDYAIFVESEVDTTLFTESSNILATSIINKASTANQLTTARTINGTLFNGSQDITTAKWGTARNINIGGVSKSVNGSTDVSWSLPELNLYGKNDFADPATTLNLTDFTSSDRVNLVPNEWIDVALDSVGINTSFTPILEVSDDGTTWTQVTSITNMFKFFEGGNYLISITQNYFRFTFKTTDYYHSRDYMGFRTQSTSPGVVVNGFYECSQNGTTWSNRSIGNTSNVTNVYNTTLFKTTPQSNASYHRITVNKISGGNINLAQIMFLTRASAFVSKYRNAIAKSFNHKSYNTEEYLGTTYVSGGAQKPTYFKAGSLQLNMLASNQLSGNGNMGWSDVLWLSSYQGTDVKMGTAIWSSKTNNKIGFTKQNFDSIDWGTFVEFVTSDNFNTYGNNFVTYTGANKDINLNKQKITSVGTINHDAAYREVAGVGRFRDIINLDGYPILKQQTHVWNGSAFVDASITSLGGEAGSNAMDAYSIHLGGYAGQFSKGTSNVNIGRAAGQFHEGLTGVNIGLGAGLYNKANYVVNIAESAGRYNIAESIVNIGRAAGYGAKGDRIVNLGTSAGFNNIGYNIFHAGTQAGEFSIGSGVSSIGYATNQYGIGDCRSYLGGNSGLLATGSYHTVIGQASYSQFKPNTGATKTFNGSDINTTNNTITINNHGFGGTGNWILCKFNEGTSSVPGMANVCYLQLFIVDANTLRYAETYSQNGYVRNGSYNVPSGQGTGTGHTLTPSINLNNIVIIGDRLEPTKSNQTLLGGGECLLPQSTVATIDADTTNKALITKEWFTAKAVSQSSINTQLTGYATLAGTQTFTGTNTFTQNIIVPTATLGSHAVNLNQLSDYVKTSDTIKVTITGITQDVTHNFNTYDIVCEAYDTVTLYNLPIKYKRKNLNTVTIEFDNPVPNSIRLMITKK